MKNIFFKKSNRLNDGFTLVETLVAISIFTVSILALLSILTQGIVNTGYAKQKIIASYIAQEGIEYARNARDTFVLYNPTSSQAGWDDFVATFNTTYPSADPRFDRTLQMNIINGDEVEILSDVSWTHSSGNYSIILSERLFNWLE